MSSAVPLRGMSLSEARTIVASTPYSPDWTIGELQAWARTLPPKFLDDFRKALRIIGTAELQEAAELEALGGQIDRKGQ